MDGALPLDRVDVMGGRAENTAAAWAIEMLLKQLMRAPVGAVYGGGVERIGPSVHRVVPPAKRPTGRMGRS